MPSFDAASSLPLHPVAREAFLAALDDGWADPGRLHREGRRARLLLDAARETAAEAVGCRPDELTFTPSGTHALHTGILGALAGRARVSRRLLVSAVEHSAVLHAADAHREAGGDAAEIGVDRTGRVAPGAVGEAIDAGGGAALVCVQSANHEVGTRQPVAEIADECAARGVPLLVDAAQSLGWEAVPGAWTLLAGSAHKWGGPGGVGLLVVRKGARFKPRAPLDEREGGRSPGFENVPAVVAAAASLRAVRAGAAAEAARLAALVDLVRAEVPRRVPDVEVVGDAVRRLPHIVTFSCLYVDGEALLHALGRAGFSVSSGSSCVSGTLTPSHVLRAMGVLSEGNVRVSLPPGTPREEVERFLAVLPDAVAGVRAQLTDVPDTAARAVRDAAGVTVDALGKLCPLPVIELARVIGDVPVGGTVTVLADDPAARLDIPAWCGMRGQTFLGGEPAPDGGVAYRVRRES
ncbi:cysteine desulfurase/sulfurtransferase TusA family protein [Streptomyces sp. RFCAC02]|uniref:cysteine desulfurase/sulfurtransferase TusA family protein n=1 Tax=Streptomyces sp. RFCAC02 TaxID=2499143 RepID=UPI00101F0C8E|nr:cysteine desulfurase/sulfurtransferase TusA family protein [Streptomyces sp. RFCAC02]